MSEQDTRRIEAQQRLELEMVQVGVAQWRASEKRKDEKAQTRDEDRLPEEGAGKRMMRVILPKLIPLIREKQQEALANLTGGKGGRPFLWAAPILCLSAEKIAVITLRSALTERAKWVHGIAMFIAKRVTTEREFELMVEAERQRVKDGKLSTYEQSRGFDKPVSVVTLMKDYAKTVDARTVRKWSAKVDHVEKLEWTDEERLSFGCLCLSLLVDAAPEWFEEVQYLSRTRGKVQTSFQLALTKEAEAYINHNRELDETAHPWLIPMITKPNAWTRKED